MRPIRTERSNFTYLGPAPSIADLPCRRSDGGVYAVFKLTDVERAAIAAGGHLQLGIYQEPIPPVSLTVVQEAEVPGPEQDGVPVAPDYRCESCEALYVSERAIALGLKCGQCGAELRLPGALA